MLALLIIPNVLTAKSLFGKIVKFEGDVTILRAGSGKKEKVKVPNLAVFEDDTIHTGKNSRVYLLMHDKSQIILKSNVEFQIEGVNEAKIINGSALFSILKRILNRNRKRLILRTATCVIGVKGTQYMVKTKDKDTQVYLKSGKLFIESASGNYLKYYNQTEDEYNEAIRKAEKEYEEFKEKAEEAYSDLVKSFSLESGQAIDVTSQTAKRISFTRDVVAEFEAFDTF